MRSVSKLIKAPAGLVTRLTGDWYDDLAVVGNPYAVRDIRSRVRGFRFPLLLLIYHAVIVGVGMIAIAIYAAGSGRETPAGRFVFPCVVYAQLALAPIVSAVLTATSVSIERERQTLEMVTMTPMHGLQVALGKMAGPWGLTFMVALTSAPYAILCMVGGGVDLASVVLLYAGLAAFCGITAAFGLLMSVVSRTSAAAVIGTLVVYVSLLLLGLVGNGLLADNTYGGAMMGAPDWAVGPYAFLFPTTWAYAMLQPQSMASHVFGESIPYWVPAVGFWGALGAYMSLVAGCRLRPGQRRHLIARRVFGLLCWAGTLGMLLGGIWPDVGKSSATGMFAFGGARGGDASMLILASSLGAAAGAVAALQGGMADSDMWTRRFGKVLLRVSAIWKFLSPRAESGLGLGLVVWAISAGLPLVGCFVSTGSIYPSGLALPHLIGLLVPQVLCICFAALVGIWANVRYPQVENRRRNAGAGRVLTVMVWPLLVLTIMGSVAASLAFRNPGASDTIGAVGGYLAGLSPLSSGTLLGMTGLRSTIAMKMWIPLGPLHLHPHMVAGALSIVLAVGAFVALARRWRENTKWLGEQGYRAE